MIDNIHIFPNNEGPFQSNIRSGPSDLRVFLEHFYRVNDLNSYNIASILMGLSGMVLLYILAIILAFDRNKEDEHGLLERAVRKMGTLIPYQPTKGLTESLRAGPFLFALFLVYEVVKA